MSKRLMKLLLFIMIPLLIITGFSSWIIVAENSANLGTTPSTNAVAYINDKTTLYTSIEGALRKAKNGDTVHVLLDSAAPNKIISRDCTIKEGVTLNISHQDGVVQSENSKGVVESTTTSNSTELTLLNGVTVKEGVKITNKGTIVISGVLSSGSAGNDVGHTSGNYARLVMDKNSKIENYGVIQCCGKIDESTLGNGSKVTVYENGNLKLPFVLKDFRGGTTSLCIYNGMESSKVSPFNQFELRNVEPFIEINYGGFLNGYSNMGVTNKLSGNYVLSPSLVKMVGDTDDYFVSLVAKDNNGNVLSNNSNNKFTYKYNKETQIANYNFYGGATINKLVVELTNPLTGGNISLSTEAVYLPFSWRVNVTLNKYPGQTDTAYFYAKNQKMKVMTGCSFVVGEGCSFASTDINVYSFFRDQKNAYSAANIGGRRYDNKEPGIFKVYGHYVNTGAFGGVLVKGTNANVSVTTKGLTTKEAFIQGSLSMDNYVLVKEDYLEVSEADYVSKKRVTFGTALTDNYATPTYSVSGGITQGSNSINKNYFVNDTNFTPNLLSNISKAQYNGSYYQKDSTISTDNKVNIFAIFTTTSTFGDPTATSVTVSGADELAAGNSTTLTAVAYNSSGKQAYTTQFTWSSSDTNLATVNPTTGKVTAAKGKTGTVTITATTLDGATVSGSKNVTITNPAILIGVSIAASKTSGSSNAAYDSTITVTINPGTAEIDTVTWSTSGTASLTLKSTTSDYKKVYTVGANSSYGDKTGTITVTVKDKQGNTKTASVELTATGKSICFAKGTLVTMGDGSQKKIEDIRSNEVIMALNHNSGMFEAIPIFVVVNHGEEDYIVTKLHFSDETSLDVIGIHGLFDVDLRKYVSITTENASEFIGHRFLKYDGVNKPSYEKYVELVSVSNEMIRTESYTIISEKYMNHIINGMVANSTVIEGICNIFNLDTSFKYDSISMEEDIEKYGLYSYEEFKNITTEEVFDKLNMKYYKIAVGKGELTYDEVLKVIELLDECYQYGQIVTSE